MAAELFSLAGKTALVTGGASGIGQAIAVALAQAGADVAITVHSAAADETHALVAATGRRYHEVQCDLGAQADVQALLGAVAAELGPVDILVNNAGIIRRADLAEFGEQDWSDVLAVNLDAVWRLSQAAARGMVQRGGGKIINIASLLSFQGGIRVPSYTASKHAVVGLTKAFANELSSKCVNVNCIAPGYIETANTAALRQDEQRSRQIMERIPAGRWGRPSDLGGAAVFLASSAADYVHGHTLVVDGGWMAR
ncbi:2-dehydro-3-deoxy-D-gluconate 5-dehydrogenase KduD [Duganella sp. HH105]|uniref:2-dehydro-3-deoxy-D-gluconate 5-dehydrogenase KduD n=1 Tax=Duganella sp. HH105 TaxID=1781067 RepID=UPI000877B4A0|nr:2-dehydro-3-deoxy-D-gluconate 5-dehydrogenase KduD [Duganella sp. HH105]OEZ61681.1 2-dehydro-3-deoxy-D-gluconate 5-dehydrogenase [Duganella sp. HH105]